MAKEDTSLATPVADAIYSLDKRTTLLEAEFEHMTQTLAETKVQINQMDIKLDTINAHIAKQNGAIPHIQEAVTSMLARMDQDKLAAVSQSASTDTRSKLLWAAVSSIITAVLAGILLAILKIN